jgi:hypothetical protein
MSAQIDGGRHDAPASLCDIKRAAAVATPLGLGVKGVRRCRKSDDVGALSAEDLTDPGALSDKADRLVALLVSDGRLHSGPLEDARDGPGPGIDRRHDEYVAFVVVDRDVAQADDSAGCVLVLAVIDGNHMVPGVGQSFANPPVSQDDVDDLRLQPLRELVQLRQRLGL